MPGDRDDGDNVIYLPQTKNIDVFPTGGGRPAGRRKPKPTRRWRSAVILAAVAFVAAMLVAAGPWDSLTALGDVAASLGGELLILATIAGVIILGAALTRKRRRPHRELRRPRIRTRKAPGDRRMELHVWCEFEIDHEPTMIEAVEAVLADLYEDEERRNWSGR